eukprot:gb/GFBE01057652.1/.p1 GENE.gb/GFBE01057652.1/~~gb/GFBE01057652.1/.p1  ORF type:complete len:410 (+),score=107.84 gb/GFBE01057652.1/:1-1230(+)
MAKTARPAKAKQTSAAKAKKTVKSKTSFKPRPAAKQLHKLAFTVAGGARGKKLAKEQFEKKKAAMPRLPRWPEDCVVDKRHVSWLPQDWTAALRLTERVPGRPGSGGLLLNCYVGPLPADGTARKRFFHKKDVEKCVGRKLDLDERGEKARVLSEHLQEKFPPESFIKRTQVNCVTQYINDRCDKMHGMKVKEVIASFKCKWRDGAMRQYNSSDLKYDIAGGRVEIVKKRPGRLPQRSAVQKLAASKPVKSDPAKRRQSAPASKASKPVEPAPAKRRQSSPAAKAGSTKATAEAMSPTQALKRRRASAAAASEVPQSRSSSSSSSSVPGSGELSSIKKLVFAPLLKRPAVGVEGEAAIFSLIGIGKSYKFDETMLDILPKVLRKQPKERGPLGDMVLKEYEQALDKASK